tara:strand:- start:7363 stop:7512 length:150 start_codon:yes stop_codon:yes gene_type:complete
MEWLTNNWEWCLIALMIAEKAVKLSPSDKDDIILDSIIKPIINLFKPKK